jgi:hypothetical protein
MWNKPFLKPLSIGLFCFLAIFGLIFFLHLKNKTDPEKVLTLEDVMNYSSAEEARKEHKIEDFKPIQSYKHLEGYEEDVLIIRSFKRDDKPSFLAVNVETLDTMILPEEALAGATNPEKTLEETRFYKLLNTDNPVKKLDSKGYALTIDLCEKPRKKERHFETRLFDFLEKISLERQIIVPVGIAVSISWIKQEPSAFERIIQMIDSGTLNVTWINHSATHPVNKGKFLTEANTDFTMEVLATEKYLLERGEIPSVFFRFPGLVHNANLLTQLKELSLIPLDANAWIAKGKKIQDGSIILIHGNGNEPEGIDIFLKFFQKTQPEFISIQKI